MKIKDIFNYLKDPNKKIYLYTSIGVVILFIIILIILLLSLFGHKKMTYSQVETVMVDSAKNYVESKGLLKRDDSFEQTINIETLIEKEYMKKLIKYNKNYETCTGEVIITYNGKDFLYTPSFDCGKNYKTVLLNDTIKQSKVNDNQDGIYQVDNYYVYKGENPDNYINFMGDLWRIVKINPDGSIKIIQTKSYGRYMFDDRYNSSCPSRNSDCKGISNFEKSRLKDYMMDLYTNGIVYDNKTIEFSDFEKSIINYQNICIGSVSENIKITDGYPECNTMTTNKYPFDFMKLNETIMPSLDNGCTSINDMQCTNYNYLNTISSYWTATTTNKNNYQVYSVSEIPNLSSAYYEKPIRFVINLSKNALYQSGNGTQDKPYTIRQIGK